MEEKYWYGRKSVHMQAVWPYQADRGAGLQAWCFQEPLVFQTGDCHPIWSQLSQKGLHSSLKILAISPFPSPQILFILLST